VLQQNHQQLSMPEPTSSSEFLDVRAPIFNEGDLKVVDVCDTEGGTSNTYCVLKEGRMFFLKCMKEELVNTTHGKEIFRKEYELGRTLDCPNVVHYHEYFEKDGVPCVLSDYIRGRNLEQALADSDSAFDAERIERLMLDVLNGLEHLHSKGIVHLDLKPGNIMLREVNNMAIITDLGFCYADTFLLSMGATKGYSAPELFEGQGIPDMRADIFSAGKVLEALVERTVLSKSDRRFFQRIIAKACAQQPDDRYVSATTMREAITLRGKGRSNRWVWPIVSMVALSALLVFFLTRQRGVAAIDEQPPIDTIGTCFNYRLVNCMVTSIEPMKCCVTGFDTEIPDSLYEALTQDVIIPASATLNGRTYMVESIADSAFFNMSNVQTVTFPNTLRHIGVSAFWGTSIGSLTLPDSIETVDKDCFQNCDHLKNVVIPSHLQAIGMQMFLYCRGLEHITIPEGVERIEMNAFVSCRSLKHVSLPSTLCCIGRGTFWDCPSLTSITIPASVTKMDDFVFWKSGLKELHMLSPRPIAITDIFGDCHPIIYVPKGAGPAYREAEIWSGYTIIEE